jgi:quercetin dioxygenase-like cupin family protein
MFPPHATPIDATWRRLANRAARSAAANRPLLTRLVRDQPVERGPGDLRWRILQDDPTRAAPRVRLAELDAGGTATLALAPERSTDLLLLDGALQADGQPLPRLAPQRFAPGRRILLVAATASRLLLRDTADTVSPDATVDAGWQRWPGGVSRRRLGLDYFLLALAPGAALPPHGHDRDEECLMLDGELHIEDRLLRAGDHQTVPAGVPHRRIVSERGALVLIHGDADPAPAD